MKNLWSDFLPVDCTHICIRSPAFIRHDGRVKVSKGSRQNSGVTSGKAIALRIQVEGRRLKLCVFCFVAGNGCEMEDALWMFAIHLRVVLFQSRINEEPETTRGIRLVN